MENVQMVGSSKRAMLAAFMNWIFMFLTGNVYIVTSVESSMLADFMIVVIMFLMHRYN